MGTDYKSLFEDFWKSIVTFRFPRAEIKFKDESRFMWLLSKLLFFTKGFMTDYTTTIGTTVYFPSKDWLEKNYRNALETVMHEYIHMWDSAHASLGYFEFTYLFPQIGVVGTILSIMAIWNTWFLLFLVCLLFILPWPSPGRTCWESNGYAMSMIVDSFFAGPEYNAKKDAEDLSIYFTSGAYYWMCRNKDKVVNMLVSKYQKLPSIHGGVGESYTWLRKTK